MRESYVLYDYKDRNPINYQASIYDISQELVRIDVDA